MTADMNRRYDEPIQSAADEMEHLRSAVESLYQAFASYPRRAVVHGCSCCVMPEDHACILSKPLRRLTPSDLQKYAFQAMSTWGDEDDFRHFLPRLLELLAFDDLHGCPEVVLGKLTYGKWRRWPVSEQSAIEQYLMSLWRTVLAGYPTPLPADHWDATTWLCALGRAVDDLQPFLGTWRQNRSTAGLRHLADFVRWHADGLLDARELQNAYWDDRELQMRQVVDWLITPATVQTLRQASEIYCAEPFAHEFSRSADQVTTLLEEWGTPTGGI
jgi:hypothetical protein